MTKSGEKKRRERDREREEKGKGKGDKCAFSEGILTAPFPTSSPFLSAVSQLSALLSVLSFDLGSTLFSFILHCTLLL